jgi:hypothetical protein
MYKLVTKGDGGSKEELKRRMEVKARLSSETRVTLL